MNLSPIQELRKVGIEDVDTLVWLKGDTGAFGNFTDGPLFDWIEGREYFLKHVKNFDTVVQAGGCCGMYPRFYSRYFKNVYTFEPDTDNYSCLDLNCTGDQYHKYNAGLGETESFAGISNGTKYNVGMHRIIENGNDVQIKTIDSLKLEACDLIHLDIEGYEPKALQGAIETIKKFNPVIIVERDSGRDVIEKLGYHRAHTLRMDSIFIL